MFVIPYRHQKLYRSDGRFLTVLTFVTTSSHCVLWLYLLLHTDYALDVYYSVGCRELKNSYNENQWFYIGTLHNLPLLPIDFNFDDTSFKIYMIEVRAHSLHSFCHRFWTIFVSIVTNAGYFCIWRICYIVYCLTPMYWFLSLFLFFSSSFNRFLYSHIWSHILFLSLTHWIVNIPSSICRRRCTKSIHIFARSMSVNNNQLFLFVAASFACLRSYSELLN